MLGSHIQWCNAPCLLNFPLENACDCRLQMVTAHDGVELQNGDATGRSQGQLTTPENMPQNNPAAPLYPLKSPKMEASTAEHPCRE